MACILQICCIQLIVHQLCHKVWTCHSPRSYLSSTDKWTTYSATWTTPTSMTCTMLHVSETLVPMSMKLSVIREHEKQVICVGSTIKYFLSLVLPALFQIKVKRLHKLDPSWTCIKQLNGSVKERCMYWFYCDLLRICWTVCVCLTPFPPLNFHEHVWSFASLLVEKKYGDSVSHKRWHAQFQRILSNLKNCNEIGTYTSLWQSILDFFFCCQNVL